MKLLPAYETDVEVNEHGTYVVVWQEHALGDSQQIVLTRAQCVLVAEELLRLANLPPESDEWQPGGQRR